VGACAWRTAEHQQSSDSNAGARIARSNWNKEREPVKGGMKNNLLRQQSHSTGTVRVMGKLEAAKVARSHTRTEAMENGSGDAVLALAGTASSVMRPSQPAGG